MGKAVTCKFTLQNCCKWIDFGTTLGGIKQNFVISEDSDYMVTTQVWQKLISNGGLSKMVQDPLLFFLH